LRLGEEGCRFRDEKACSGMRWFVRIKGEQAQ